MNQPLQSLPPGIAMHDPTPQIIAILAQYVREPGYPIAMEVPLSDLEIDRLDLPMIVLDVEDAFAIQVPYNEEIESFATVGALVACVRSGLEARAARPLAAAPRKKRRPWMSTVAERRR
ncbi:MAG: acyl carrier protein [Hyphomicrobiaceae bacterium]|nr:MAG: acyl carrier protein [Hyphomicrobiaceae bacterium]